MPTNLPDAADRARAGATRLADLAERDIARATRTLAYARVLIRRTQALSAIDRIDATVRQGAIDRASQAADMAAGEASAAQARAAMAALEGEAVWPIALEALATYPHPIRLWAGLLWGALWARVRTWCC